MCTMVSFCCSMFLTGFPWLLHESWCPCHSVGSYTGHSPSGVSKPSVGCPQLEPLRGVPLWHGAPPPTSTPPATYLLVSLSLHASPNASPHMSSYLFSSYSSSPGGCCSFLDVSEPWISTLPNMFAVLGHDGEPAWVQSWLCLEVGSSHHLPCKAPCSPLPQKPCHLHPIQAKAFQLKIIFTFLAERVKDKTYEFSTFWRLKIKTEYFFKYIAYPSSCYYL